MAYTTIDDPSAYFQTKLYSGNSTQTAITYDGNSNLQPDWIWAKSRTNTHYHDLRDSTRGVDLRLVSNTTDAESTKDQSYVSFDSNGFTLGDDTDGGALNTVNTTGNNYVSWGWKANGGTTSSNTDGSITSTVQANTTAGFSIVTYTGNATAGATVGHGLGAVPNWIIVKNRDAAKNWVIYHESIGNDRSITLNTSDAQSASTDHWNNNTPTSSVFYLGDYSHVNATDNFVAYCFAEKQGYSKFGSYTGNGSTDGAFVYTGFSPAWVMVRRFDSGNNWHMHDNKRVPYNSNNKTLYANITDSEGTEDFDMLSNGFKLRESGGGYNASGGTYIYMAFAEHPFVSSEGVPTTAR
jgi:hypothetical protein